MYILYLQITFNQNFIYLLVLSWIHWICLFEIMYKRLRNSFKVGKKTILIVHLSLMKIHLSSLCF